MASNNDSTLKFAQTPLDQLCEEYVQKLGELSPTWATEWGLPEVNFDGELQDYSPEYWDAVDTLNAQVLAKAEQLPVLSSNDRLTLASLLDRLESQRLAHSAGDDVALLNNIKSPVQFIRNSLAQLDEGSAQYQSRLSRVPRALAGYRESLELSLAQGHAPARRQVQAVHDQIASDPLFADFDQWLVQWLLPRASAEDSVGREKYERGMRELWGFDADPDEAYEWGQEQVHIYEEKLTQLDRRYGAIPEKHQVWNPRELEEWMHANATAVMDKLDGVVVDFPSWAHDIDCVVEYPGSGVVFYTQASADMRRPGRVTWSIPEDTPWPFAPDAELTTVYHEGAPGHHLQYSTALAQEDLNSWRRVVAWNSGYGEGWALYAEQLMVELGFHEYPATLRGVYESQLFRAARVVADIGLHLGKISPAGEPWDVSAVKQYLAQYSSKSDAVLDFEATRYAGWPAQASSYLLGQREWLLLREQFLAKKTTLRDFHARALGVGNVPLSVLRGYLLG